MSLQAEIDSARAVIKTDSYAMSIGEWISLYTDGELDIHPEFQRFFRWKSPQKSRFIESILLGIPIPPIFVAQRPDGVWDVVDGLQRLSTIFEFAGLLKNDVGVLLPPLQLERTKYLPSMDGKRWEIGTVDQIFDAAQRLIIKRTKIGVSIILSESDPKAKYELFQRLNTGGTELSDQEVRNSILVMINSDFYRWLNDLASRQSFRDTLGLTDRALSERFDLEMILRFLVFRKMDVEQLSNIGDLGDFLTESMIRIAQDRDFDREAEAAVFNRVFDFLYESVGGNPFRKWSRTTGRITGGFSVSAFEIVALGLAFHDGRPDPQIEEKLVTIWEDPVFLHNSGSGVRASSRIPITIPLGRRIFA